MQGYETLVEREKLERFAQPVEAYLKSYDDASTWLAEVLDGSMRTPFEFSFDGQDFYGRDGRGMRTIFEDAIVDARRTALINPALAFEVARRQTEFDEFKDMVKMGHGVLPNTMVVVSDFPEVLQDAQQDIGGYNIERRTTMLRVVAMDGDGRMMMYSQSLDASDRGALEAIYRSLGFEPQQGELLGQRMHLQLDAKQQEVLIDRLTGVYDRMMSAQYGGDWYAGRRGAERINTYEFVRQQDDLLDTFVRMQLSDPQRAEAYRYDIAATMEKRFNSRHTIDPVRAVSRRMYGDADIMREMAQAGREAMNQGKTFSGCGLTAQKQAAAEDGRQNTEEQLNEAGYGNSEKYEKLPDLLRCINKKCRKLVPSKEVVKPKSWCCPACKYEIDICSGKVICYGNK